MSACAWLYAPDLSPGNSKFPLDKLPVFSPDVPDTACLWALLPLRMADLSLTLDVSLSLSDLTLSVNGLLIVFFADCFN